MDSGTVHLIVTGPPGNKKKWDRYTIIGLQQFNRANGYMKNETGLRMGRAVGRSQTLRRR